MWSTVLIVALLGGFNPVRLGITLLVISRPRPIQNLLAYWCGCVIVSFLCLIVPLILLHATPLLGSFADDLATPTTEASSGARHFQIGLGLLVLVTAAVMIYRLLRSRRTRELESIGSVSSSAHGLTPPSTAHHGRHRMSSEAPERVSGIRRLVQRGKDEWANGALWVSTVIGIGTGPGIDGALYVLAIIVPTGAPVAAQFGAAVVFIVLMLGIVEITLVSYLITPRKTQAVVEVLHGWAKSHGRLVVIAMLIVIGAAMLNQGFGIL